MTSRPSEAPRVSVLMAVYDAEAYLAQAIESILVQTFTDFEFLIVDDGSSDRSRAIVEGYAAKDPRIRVHARENRGLAASLNELIDLARGEYLARMDSDDVSWPERFAVQVAHLDAHPEIDVLGGMIRFIDEAGRPIIDTRTPTQHEEIDADNLIGRTALAHPTVMMRKTAVQVAGGYDPTYLATKNLDLWLRMAEGGRLAALDRLVLDYRFVATGISGKRQAEQAAAARRACEAAWSRRRLPPQDFAFRPWRPGSDRTSQREFALKWAWQARKFGYIPTARHYFLKALRTDPLSSAAWKGVVFGLILGGRRP